MIEKYAEATLCKAKRAYVDFPFWSLKDRAAYAELYLTDSMIKSMGVTDKPFWMWSMSRHSPLGTLDPTNPEFVIDLKLDDAEYFATKKPDIRKNLMRALRKGDEKFKLTVLENDEIDDSLLAFADRNFSKKYFWFNAHVEDFNVLFEEYATVFDRLNSSHFWKWKLTDEGKMVGIVYLYKSKLDKKEVRDCWFVWNYNYRKWYPGIYTVLKLRTELQAAGYELYNMCTGNYSYKNDLKTGACPSKQYVQMSKEYAAKYEVEVNKCL